MLNRLLAVITNVAPGAADLITDLISQKFKDRDIMLILLAINIDQAKKLNQACVDIQAVRELLKK